MNERAKLKFIEFLFDLCFTMHRINFLPGAVFVGSAQQKSKAY